MKLHRRPAVGRPIDEIVEEIALGDLFAARMAVTAALKETPDSVTLEAILVSIDKRLAPWTVK